MHAPALALVLVATPLAAQSWTPTNPDVNGALSFGGAFALAPDGRAVGFGVFGSNGTRPAYWDAAGSHELPLLVGDDEGLAVEVNGTGTIVGVSVDYEQQWQLTLIHEHPVVWKNGQALDLRTLVTGGDPLELLTCTAVYAQGRIIGRARELPPGNGGRAFLFDNGIVTDLGDLNPTGYGGSEAHAFGAHGEIVGASTAPTSFTHAVRWKNGVISDLHDFAQMPGRNSHAYAINANGVIVGSGDFGADFLDYETGALWKNGVITNLGSLAPGQYWQQAFAFGINLQEQVVGATNLPNGEARAFLWQNGVMRDLTALLAPAAGWILTSAEDIDDSGRIAGQGLFQGSLLPFIAVPNCDGTYTALPGGCAGSGGFTPQLAGVGCPGAGSNTAVEVTQGVGGGFGLLLFGTGNGALPITPSCALGIAPLLGNPVVPFGLQGSGAGGGAHAFVFSIAAGTSAFDVWTQAAVIDAGAPGLVAATNPLLVHVQ
jgi:probable HAF family extracellular repeat protein